MFVIGISGASIFFIILLLKNLGLVVSRVRPDFVTTIVSLSILASLVSLSQAVSTIISAVDTVNFIFWQLIIWFLFQFRDKIPWDNILKGATHGLSFSIIYHLALSDFLSALPFLNSFGQNGIAYIAIAFIPLAIYYYVIVKSRSFLLIAGLYLLAISLIGSRAGFFIVCIEIALMYYLFINKKPTVWNVGGFVMILGTAWYFRTIFIPLLALINEEYALLLSEGSTSTDTSALVRLAQIEKGVGIFLKRPFFGYGINSFKIVEYDYSSLNFEGADLVKRSTKLANFQAHNSYITLMVEMGGVITLAFLFLVLSNFNSIIRNLRRDTIFIFLLVALLGSLTHLFFIDIILGNSFWFHLGTIYAISKIDS